ncbi:MAG: M20 family metallopeptidase [bacterium]
MALADGFEKSVVAMRRALHAIPEGSFREEETQAQIAAYLKQAGIDFKSRVAGTGVAALVRPAGKTSAARRPTVALRADMDALSLTERTGLPFASKNPGFMHACGHDAHMAMVLGAGMVLKAMEDDLAGNVRLIFQPAEETPPGGALGMIRAGVLRTPPVGAVIGIHVDPAVPAGKVAVNAGPISAAADDFTVTITGRAGHGSAPHKGVDAIAVAAEFISALQQVVSRRVSAMDNVVVSVGTISGGTKHNIIAETVTMNGTVRTKKAGLRRQVPAMIKQVLEGTCAAFGAKGEFKYDKGYPAVVCDEALSDQVRGWCRELLGAPQVIRTTGFEMGGEDFAYYAQQVPGTFILLGVTNERKGKTYLLHQPQFDIDEDVLKLGVEALAYSAYRRLEASR